MISPLMAALFLDAIEVHGPARIVLTLPLCLAIAVVYKTLRCEEVKDITRAVAPLWITIVAGIYLVGFVLGGLFLLLA